MPALATGFPCDISPQPARVPKASQLKIMLFSCSHFQPVLSGRPKAWQAAVAMLALAGGLTLAACSPAPAPPEATTQPPLLELAASDRLTVTSGEIARTLQVNGSLHAVNETLVRAQVAGEVLKVDVQVGEHIRSDQELARIDDLDYRARVDDRAAALAAGRAQQALAETTRRKNENLLEKNFLSDLAYDNIKSSATIADAQVESLQAQLKLAENALQNTLIRAPIAGWIAERHIQRGDKVSPDTPLFSIVDLGRLELEAQVPAHEIAQVSIGQPFKTTVEGYGERAFAGHVARIGPRAQAGSRAVGIFIEIPNPQGELKAGLFATGQLTLARHTARALVPLTAIRTDLGRSFVYLIDQGKIRRQTVETGIEDTQTGMVEVRSGLEAGAEIIAVNLGPLREGAAVRMSSSTQTSDAPAVP